MKSPSVIVSQGYSEVYISWANGSSVSEECSESCWNKLEDQIDQNKYLLYS